MTMTLAQDEVDALALRDAIRASGIRAEWAMTGGNTGTMYCGPEAHTTEGGDPRPFPYSGEDYSYPACLIGPGNYGAGTLSTWELFIGPDESFDPTTAEGVAVASREDGEPVDIAVLVEAVRVQVAESVRRWKTNASVVIHS